MNFTKLINESNASPYAKSVTVAFLGDSITQGVFELKRSETGGIELVYDYENVYHNIFKRKLNTLYPYARINIINAGSNGTDANFGYERLQRDVLAYSPDLVVVCFGTNDCLNGEKGIKSYEENLEKIFLELKKANAEIIFMTPNLMAEYMVNELYELPEILELAQTIVDTQTSGVADFYFDTAKEVCKRNSVTICDCRAKWIKMREDGVDTTALLCNHLNHPSRDMHLLFAESLIETIMKDGME